MRVWFLATEEGAKERERLEYTAIIDDAEDILATQWETAVRHYLSRMKRLNQQRCLKFWVDWATQRANEKNIMLRVQSRLTAMRCAASFVAWQAHASRSVRSKTVCNRAVNRLTFCLLCDSFDQWCSCIRANKRVRRVLSMAQHSFVAFVWTAWKGAVVDLRNARKVHSFRTAVESAENLCLAQFHRSIRLLTERCARRRSLRWLSETWLHWERHVEISRREKMQAKAEFDLQEMQRQAELLVELRVELAESHRENAQLCHEAELSARREKAVAEAQFVVEQERSEQVQTVSLVRDEVLNLRQELSEREKELAGASKREAALMQQRELAERSYQEAERRAELERSEIFELQRQAETERSLQEQSIVAAQAELSRVQERELAEIKARKAAERDKEVAQRRASVERSEHAEAKRQAQIAMDEISRLRQHQADELAEQERRVEAAAAFERNQKALAMKTVHDEVSRMQEVFQAAGTPPASPRAPQQLSDTHDVSSIADMLRATAETTQEELQRRADSLASLRAELDEARAEALRRSEAEAAARREAQEKARAMIEQAHDATSLQLAAQEIVSRVESVAHGEPAAVTISSKSAGTDAPSREERRARRGSWLLVPSPESAYSSPPQHRSAAAMRLSPEGRGLGKVATSAVAVPRQVGGMQIQFSHNVRTPPPQVARSYAMVPNTVQRGAGSWRAYEKEADELNAQAKADARRRLAAERQAEEMEAKLAQMQALLADDASDCSSQDGID
jgi:hypothetical protein